LPDRPTAVITYEADRALPVFCAALKLGWMCRAICRFYLFTTGRWDGWYALTTMEIPMVQTGAAAVEW
jgi:DNA-binding LacI/PurR family transcriptional regulator